MHRVSFRRAVTLSVLAGMVVSAVVGGLLGRLTDGPDA